MLRLRVINVRTEVIARSDVREFYFRKTFRETQDSENLVVFLTEFTS